MFTCTVLVCRVPHRKWRETNMQPSRASIGQQLSCCLFSLHFLWGILRTSPVHTYTHTSIHTNTFLCLLNVLLKRRTRVQWPRGCGEDATMEAWRGRVRGTGWGKLQSPPPLGTPRTFSGMPWACVCAVTATSCTCRRSGVLPSLPRSCEEVMEAEVRPRGPA